MPVLCVMCVLTKDFLLFSPRLLRIRVKMSVSAIAKKSSLSSKRFVAAKTPTTRGLIVMGEWLDRIFDPVDPKTWEIRTMSCKEGRTFLIGSKGLGILGECVISECIETSKEELLSARSFERHRIPSHRISTYTGKNKKVFIWVLTDVVRYDTVIAYRVPPGCVIWCKQGLPLTYST